MNIIILNNIQIEKIKIKVENHYLGKKLFICTNFFLKILIIDTYLFLHLYENLIFTL